MQENQKNLAGIRGWLLFYVIFSIVGFLINLFGLYNEFYIFKLIETLEWNIERVYDVGAYILLEILIVISLFYLLKKNKNGPQFTIITELIGILIGIIDFFFSNRRIDEVLELMLTIILGTIWILYFRYSKRVKATFG
ncbi:DUF2569 family protein [Paenibacillus sedimenti]|uniref:DUF2569 family protein n=1 Tax=Paenibacillus sedimenti TaxID=2770274 RepID=A0A926QJ04_9BACL|nr:DUF2569 family protein [Paenibacillus sedimenti]MBD0379887.1 DUF2569 family protein [Paenibacillus sedimenti]